jgi:DNA-nicking Smr family endonuclease
VLVVHGRGQHSGGQPVLREVVIAALTSAPLATVVRAFCAARPADGGGGALYVHVGAS